MTKLFDAELLEDRARDLEVNGKNGIERRFRDRGHRGRSCPCHACGRVL